MSLEVSTTPGRLDGNVMMACSIGDDMPAKTKPKTGLTIVLPDRTEVNIPGTDLKYLTDKLHPRPKMPGMEGDVPSELIINGELTILDGQNRRLGLFAAGQWKFVLDNNLLGSSNG
jgi:hypothetical protein